MMDMVLQQQVLAALRKSPWLFGSVFEFKMESRDRIILQGTVASYFLKQIAQETLRTIEGVPEVQNDICVMKKK